MFLQRLFLNLSSTPSSSQLSSSSQHDRVIHHEKAFQGVSKKYLRSKALVFIAAYLAAACSSGLQGQHYEGGGQSFDLGPIPGTWKSIDVTGTLLAFRNDQKQQTIAINARCGKDADDVPLEALTQHLFLQFTEKSELSSEKFMLDGREALKTDSEAKLDGVPRHFRTVVLKKDGCVYDFLLIAEPNSEAAFGDFDQCVAGFRKTP